ncbi:MAG: ThiF family adenylyltransferase [Candidatus Caldarchaeum sp.]
MGESPTLARYDRQLRLEGWDQYKLMSAKVVIAGVGALGCETAKNLALMGVGELLLVDNDVVELSNLSRQMLYVDEDVGKPKALVAENRVKKMNPSINVVSLQMDVRQIPEEVFAKADVLVSCVDNWPTRRWINSMAVELGKPLVDIATDAYYGNVQVVVAGKTACIECHAEALIPTEVQSAECSLRRRKPEDLIAELREKGISLDRQEAEKLFRHNIKTLYDIKYAPQRLVDSLDENLRSLVLRLRGLLNPKMPALQSVSATIAGLGVFETVRVLHKGLLGKPFSGLLMYDGLKGRLTKVRLDRNMLCHVCSVDEEQPIELEISNKETVADIRERIANKFMFPDAQIQFGAKLLDDSAEVREIGLMNRDILYVHSTRRATPLAIRVKILEDSDQRG